MEREGRAEVSGEGGGEGESEWRGRGEVSGEGGGGERVVVD